ncbi:MULTISPECIES: hypothetical protein [Actinomadura]|uniref:DUF11 domain-containing protein n=1 Tax=Actinomadura yumaensis TaxID=111807 RepID=A0ABW2CQT7_9ACTN|nr:hypothetical protein [Actinomadura sp. J1-007]MWK36197.1 hypothetical protein [Actinomadura sp. J1-007]
MRPAGIAGGVAVVLAVAVVAAVTVFGDGGPGAGSRPVNAAHAASGLRLDADAAVLPVGTAALVPGGAYEYTFRVRNTGRRPVRSLIARSEQVTGPRAGKGLRVVAISDPSCRAGDRVDCHFPVLRPGDSRTVRVRVRAAAARRAGDELAIRTYLATYAPIARGQVTYDVLGEARTTRDTFGDAPSATPAPRGPRGSA